jgi:hypothetical protein
MLRYDKVFLDKHQLVRHHDLELGKLPSDCFQYLHIIRLEVMKKMYIKRRKKSRKKAIFKPERLRRGD